MSLSFGITDNDATRRYLYKALRMRIEGCYLPRCWTLKPGDSGQIYLNKNVSASRKRVEIKRLLFYIACGEVPDMENIKTRCQTPRCVNPAHCYSRSIKPDIGEMVVRNWITADQIYEYWGGPKPHKEKVEYSVEVEEPPVENTKEEASWYRHAREAPAVGRKATFDAGEG